MKFISVFAFSFLWLTFMVTKPSLVSVSGFNSNENASEISWDKSFEQPVELGKVRWERDFEKGIAIATAEASEKPIFLLFQEVPGCSTCQQYGSTVLSHPLIVEAIETEFVPIAVFNNKGGEDKKVLDYFKEPAWNNPVVRIIDKNKKNVIPRLSGNYSPVSVVGGMIDALQNSRRPIPEYLKLLQQSLEAEARGTEQAVVSMYCFWTGEKKLAQIPGVVGTLPGFMGGKEVVLIDYDPALTDYESVLKQASKASCASHVFAKDNYQFKTAANVVGERSVSEEKDFSIDADPKYYLSKTNYQYIPMTKLQATLVNSEIGRNSNPDFLLSPGQLNILAKIEAKELQPKSTAINKSLLEAWAALK